MVSQSQARRETNFEETEIVKDKNVSRGMVELWKDLVNRRKGTSGKKVDLILYPKTGLRKKAIQSDLHQHQTLQVHFGSIETKLLSVM